MLLVALKWLCVLTCKLCKNKMVRYSQSIIELKCIKLNANSNELEIPLASV